MKSSGVCRWLVPLLLCFPPLQATAQALEPGQRVRIRAGDVAGDPWVAEVVRVEQDSVVLLRDGAPLALSRSSITSIELATGTHRHTLRGALIGGLAVGVALGQDMIRKPGQCSGSGNYGELCALYLTGAMVGGAVLGGIVGALIRHDDWISVSLEEPDPATFGRPDHRLSLLVRLPIGPRPK